MGVLDSFVPLSSGQLGRSSVLVLLLSSCTNEGPWQLLLPPLTHCFSPRFLCVLSNICEQLRAFKDVERFQKRINIYAMK